MIEAIIGFFRYALEQCFDKRVYRSQEAIDELKIRNFFTQAEYDAIMKMMGWNVLVHDYLNIDNNIILSIINKSQYSIVFDITDKLKSLLNETVK